MSNNKIWAGNPNRLSKIDGSGIFNEIPAGIYEPYSSMMGTFLGRQEDKFVFSHKIYGIEHNFIQHVLRTYEHSDKNVGVLMNGTKGAGKTVTAKTLANMCGLPIILVNAGNIDILSYFDDVSQPLCFFFDEFEKIMDHSDNAKVAPLLSFVDGTSSSTKHLMLFTSNESKISPFFLDRPGRIRYIKQYGSLEAPVIKEILDDMLEYPEFRKDILDWVVYFKYLTIDMLISIIKEVNIHRMSPKAFGHFFNVNNEKPTYNIEVTVTHMLTGKVWNIEHWRIYSDTTISQLLDEFDDHDRSLTIRGRLVGLDEKTDKWQPLSDVDREYYMYLEMLDENDKYYDETKNRFMFAGNSYTDRIGLNQYFSPESNDSSVCSPKDGWKQEDHPHLVVDLKFIAKNNYNNYAF